MTLGTGTRLGPYEIQAPLGAGGMGEVYRARDTRLDRPVAIKVLPGVASQSAELRERFVREARLLSSLNHPHICVVYDVDLQNEISYLVMELLEGETLAARLARGPVPVREATSIALQIGSALDRAHRVGIIHRDVKPENVMLTRSGAKLLDFGLAKPVTIAADFTGPTDTLPITGQGTILGTLQYMAPEQLEGRPADARSDIFSFGAVLYEMITGKRAFEGDTPVSVISAILRDTPRPLSGAQPFVPPALDAIVQTCLEKDPDERWHSAHDLASQLRWIQQSGSQAALPAQRAGRRWRREYAAWALALVLGTTAAGLFVFRRSNEPPAQPIRFTVGEPVGARFNPRNLVSPVPTISPDGRHIALTALVADTGSIFVRSLDSVDARVLPGTEGGLSPFWSADSRYLGFLSGGALRKTSAASGGVETICKLDGALEGASWNRDNVILFSRGNGGLFRVSADGGEPVAVTTLDPARKERSHRWPAFLPDGRHFVFLAEPDNAIYYGSLDGTPPRRLLAADAKAVYSPPGYLLFARESALYAQRFDADSGTLDGEPAKVAPDVRAMVVGGRGAYSVSESGVLVYRAGDAKVSVEARWVDRDGTRREGILDAADYREVSLGPDGRRLAFHRHDEAAGGGGIWVKDLVRGNIVRLTSHPSHNTDPAWNPQGTHVTFRSDRNGVADFFTRNASAGGEDELLLKTAENKSFPGWSRDGRLLVYSVSARSMDIWVWPRDGGKPEPYIQTSFNEIQPRFSPDGRWIAYASDESGRHEVYVAPYPANGDRYPISAAGGVQPTWRADGRELFFVTTTATLAAVSVNPAGPTFVAGTPRPLFQIDSGGASLSSGSLYEPSPDGQRFVVAERPTSMRSSLAVEPLTVVVNWTAALTGAR